MNSARSLLMSKRTNGKDVLRRVCIVGGTHGNERSGVHLVRLFEEMPELVRRPTFETVCLASNLDAIAQDRRYIATDLNRCFDNEYLKTAEKTPASERHSEMKRALELDKVLGPKFSANPRMDMVFDLHNTTANCGVLLCFHREDEFARQVAAFLKECVDPEICTVCWPQDDPPFLPTIGRSGMTVEVGPVAHSTVKAEIFERTKTLLMRALDYVELHNQYLMNPSDPGIRKLKVKLPLAERVAQVDYPRDSQGQLTAFIHPSVQGMPELNVGKKSSLLKHGSPAFQTLSGKTVCLDLKKQKNMKGEPWDLSEPFYPMFVNEAAYYEKGTAFFLTRIVELDVDILSRNSAPSKM